MPRSLKSLAAVCVLLFVSVGAHAQPLFGAAESIECSVANSEIVFVGTLVDFDAKAQAAERAGREVTIAAEETLKGAHHDRRRVRLVCPVADLVGWKDRSARLLLAVQVDHPAGTGVIDLADKGLSVLTSDLTLLRKPEEVIRAAKETVRRMPGVKRIDAFRLEVPREAVVGTKWEEYYKTGGYITLEVPVNERLEKRAHDFIRSKDSRRREEGARALRHFKTDENTVRVKALLDDAGWAYLQRAEENKGVEVRHHGVRQEAYQTLAYWGVKVERPVIRVEVRKAERAGGDAKEVIVPVVDSPIGIEIVADKKEYPSRGAIRLTVTYTNTSKAAVELLANGSVGGDGFPGERYEVMSGAGRTVYAIHATDPKEGKRKLEPGKSWKRELDLAPLLGAADDGKERTRRDALPDPFGRPDDYKVRLTWKSPVNVKEKPAFCGPVGSNVVEFKVVDAKDRIVPAVESPIRIEIAADKKEYPFRGAIRLTVSYTNTSKEKVELHANGTVAPDGGLDRETYEVTTGAGRTAYAVHAIEPAEWRKTLEAGEGWKRELDLTAVLSGTNDGKERTDTDPLPDPFGRLDDYEVCLTWKSGVSVKEKPVICGPLKSNVVKFSVRR